MPRPAAPQGADSEPHWHNARLDTPHPRLAPLGTPSPAPRRRGAGGAGDGPAAAPVGGHRGALAAFPALAGRTGHACVTRRVKHARPLQGTAVVGKVSVHHRQATVAERPVSVGAQRASPVRPDRRGNRAVVDRPPARVSLTSPPWSPAPPPPDRPEERPWTKNSRWPTASGTPYRRGSMSRPPLQRRPVSLDHQLFDAARFSYYPVSVVANESHSRFMLGRA